MKKKEKKMILELIESFEKRIKHLHKEKKHEGANKGEIATRILILEKKIAKAQELLNQD